MENQVVVRTLVDKSARQGTQKTSDADAYVEQVEKRNTFTNTFTSKCTPSTSVNCCFRKLIQQARKKELLGWIAGNERKAEQNTFGS